MTADMAVFCHLCMLKEPYLLVLKSLNIVVSLLWPLAQASYA